MMVRKYIIGENELCAFGEVIKKILDDSLVVSCRTKASDLLRVLKRVKFEGTLEPYIYDVEVGKLEEIRQGNLSSVTDEYNDKGLLIILDENDYVLYIDSKVYDVLVSKGDVYSHSDEIQDSIYLDPLTGYILYGTTVDACNLLVGYGVLLDMVHGQSEGVTSVAGMYSTNMGYRCFGPVFFPEHATELPDANRSLTFGMHDKCPFCGGEITVSKHDVEICKNIKCAGRKIYGIYSLIGQGELPNKGTRDALKELIDKGYDTVMKMEDLSIEKDADNMYTSDILHKAHSYRWNIMYNQDSGIKAFIDNFSNDEKLPLDGMKLYVVNLTSFIQLTNDLEILGATVENYCDKITEEHILLSENPETLAELINTLETTFSLKSIRSVNISDCKTSIDVAKKLMDSSNYIKTAMTGMIK